jgi:MFS family permease
MRPLLRSSSRLLRALFLLAAAPALGALRGATLPGAPGGRAAGPASRVRSSLRASSAEGLFAEVVSACVGPTVLVGWALHLGAPPLEVGLVAALPQLAQLFQLPGAFGTALLGRRRAALWAVTLSRQALLPLAALPLLPLGDEGKRALLLAVAAASAALGVVGNNAWTAWMGELVPAPLRGRYFGARTALCTAGGTLAGLAAGALLDAAGGRAMREPALALLALLGCAAGAVTTVLLARQHDPPAPGVPPPTLALALRPLRDPAARGLLRYQVAWNAAVGLGGGYFTFHLLGNLHAGFTVVALHAACAAAVRVVAAPAWGRAIDRFGARPVLAACSFGAAVLPVLWIAAAPDRLWPIALDAVLSGVAWGGHGLAAFAAPLAVAPRRERPYWLAAFGAAGGLAYAAAASAGGVLAASLPPEVASLGTGGPALLVVFLLSATLRLASAFLALDIAEEGAGSLAELRRAATAGARAALFPQVTYRPSPRTVVACSDSSHASVSTLSASSCVPPRITIQGSRTSSSST